LTLSLLEVLLLGLVQGITEFLPVSSDGHLTVLLRLFSLDEKSVLPFKVMLHAATALAMVVFFAPTIWRLLSGLWAREPAQRKGSWLMVLFIVVASVPAGVVGYTIGDWLETAFATPLLIGLMMLVSGGIVFGTRYARGGGALTWWRALLVGLAQAVGIIPAISRSGATIATGLYAGLERAAAFEFSFLLAIPAILGAFVLEVRKLDMSVVHAGPLAAGMVVAFGSGLAALYVLRKAVLSRRLYWFAYYCWAAGLAVILFVR
jgi:undecaprenyl-diphosphatase